ncbi:MAG: hypothetical protein WC683_01650 [bacterium]
MLTEKARQLRQLMRESTREPRQESLEEGAPAFRTSQAEVERLLEALLGGSQVKPRLQAVVGKEGDAGAVLAELRQALYPVIVNCLQRVGGKVSGASAASVRTALRGMAQAEEAPGPAPDPTVDPAADPVLSPAQ